MILLAILLVAAAAAAYRLADYYVRFATRSTAMAGRVWGDFEQQVRHFVSESESAEVSKLAIHMAAAAGCGCFVRGALMSHYLPRFSIEPKEERPGVQSAFAQVGDLPHAQREAFSKLIVMTLIYDSFRNPLQGWFFRRMLDSFTKPTVSWTHQQEAKLAAFSVLSRRQAIAR